MAILITQQELRNNIADIFRRLDEGETFILTRNGKPVGLLTPTDRPQFTRISDAVEAFKGMAPISFEEFRRDVDEFMDLDPTPKHLRD